MAKYKKPEVFMDLRGVECPVNFVKAKILMDSLAPGSHLTLMLDDGEPIDNVPQSFLLEGHSIIEQEIDGNAWKVTIEKSHNQ